MDIKLRVKIQLDDHEVDKLEGVLLTLIETLTSEEETMTAISDAVTKVKEGFARMDVSFAGISADITAILAKVQELQGTATGLSPEDQSLLDEIQTMAVDFAIKLETLDAQNPAA